MISEFALGVLTATVVALSLIVLCGFVVIGWVWSWATRYKKFVAERVAGDVYMHVTLREQDDRPRLPTPAA